MPESQAPTGGTPNTQFVSSSYRGMAGVTVGNDQGWGGFPSEVLFNFGQNAGSRGMLHTDWVGSPTAKHIACITDGTSNTLFIGERTTKTRHPSPAGFSAAPSGPTRSIFTICPMPTRFRRRCSMTTSCAGQPAATKTSANMAGAAFTRTSSTLPGAMARSDPFRTISACRSLD